jgi:ketosteroid isomerase-like protein
LSAENVNLVRAFYEYSGGRDLVEALASEEFVEAGQAAFGYIIAPDFEFVLVRGDVGEQGVYPGVGGLVKGMRDWVASFRSYVTEVEDVIDLGDRVMVLTDEHGVSRGGEVPIRQRGAVIWTFRGERVSRIETYLQRNAAFQTLAEEEQEQLARAGLRVGPAT